MSVRAVRPGLVTLAEIASEHAVDERTVRRWVKAGAPVARRGKPGRAAPMFDAERIRAWVDARAAEDEDLAAALAAKLDAKARLTARQLAKLEAAHVPVDDVATAWAAEQGRVSERCARFRRDLSPAGEAAAGEGAAAVERVLHQLGRALLTDLGAGSDPTAGSALLRPRAIATSATLRSARAQLATVETAVLDLRERVEAGALVATTDVERQWNARVAAFRATVLSWPTTLADRLHRAATLRGDIALRTAVEAAVSAALNELMPAASGPARKEAPARCRRAARRHR